jgi:hypothetical protein
VPFSCKGKLLFQDHIKEVDMREPSAAQPLNSGAALNPKRQLDIQGLPQERLHLLRPSLDRHIKHLLPKFNH